MLIHPVSMMRAATGGGSGPTLRGTDVYGRYFGATPAVPLDAGITEGDFVIVAIGAWRSPIAPTAIPSWLTYLLTLEPLINAGDVGSWQRIYYGTAPSSPPSTADFTWAANNQFSGASFVYDSGSLGNYGTDDSAQAPVAGLTTTGITVLADSALAVFATTANQNLTNMNSTPTAVDLFAITDTQTKSHLLVNVEGLSAGTSTGVVIDIDSGDSATSRLDVVTIEVRA